MYKNFFKRIFDIIFSIIALPFLIVIVIIVAPIIYFNDKGSIFYIASRLGKNGKVFKMYKFRSMKVNAPDIRNSDGSTFCSDTDERLTRIGRILRKYSIDEIPQIFNIIKGDMSVVGPRPNMATGKFEYFNRLQRKRITVRPGITGYSQSYFRNSISQEKKYHNDCYYIDNLSFCFDTKILFKTFLTVVMKKNIYQESSNIEISENRNNSKKTLDIERKKFDDGEFKNNA